MPDVSENLLYEIERHINNYFNQQNKQESTERNYPPAFLELAEKIADYNKNAEKNGVVKETNFEHSYTVDLDFLSWQKAFARDLSIYKRVKFL